MIEEHVMVVKYNGSPFQKDEKWIEKFKDVIVLFNLKDLHKFCQNMFSREATL